MLQSETYISEANELDIIDTEAIDKCIDFNNCHLVVKYLLWKDEKLSEAIMNEFEAQMRFGYNNKNLMRREEHE